jgi:hypothetical protein
MPPCGAETPFLLVNRGTCGPILERPLTIPPTLFALADETIEWEGYFRCWHKCEVPRRPLYRRYRRKSGSDSDIVKQARLTHNGSRSAPNL